MIYQAVGTLAFVESKVGRRGPYAFASMRVDQERGLKVRLIAFDGVALDLARLCPSGRAEVVATLEGEENTQRLQVTSCRAWTPADGGKRLTLLPGCAPATKPAASVEWNPVSDSATPIGQNTVLAAHVSGRAYICTTCVRDDLAEVTVKQITPTGLTLICSNSANLTMTPQDYYASIEHATRALLSEADAILLAT